MNLKLNFWPFKKYEEWKDGLPDMAWLKEVFPDNEQWQKFSNGVIFATENIKNSIEIGLFSDCRFIMKWFHLILFFFF